MNQEQIKKFDEEGCLVIPDFISEDFIQELQQECSKILGTMDNSKDGITVFDTGKKRTDNYFLTSGDKIRFFFEKGGVSDNGELKADPKLAVNKIGHALHLLSPAFKRLTFSQKVQAIAQSLGYKDPVIAQSMYIFKQPHIGDAVKAHQDSSYLYTQPMSLLGFWIPLQDATHQNGCLSYIPGSHKSGLHNDQRLVLNPDIEHGTTMVGTPPTYEEKDFKLVEVPKGSLVLIHGLVVHKSEKNVSANSRHAYTFHVYDKANSVYCSKNWLQPTEEYSFAHLYQKKSTH
ncbi:phytanoyl-CoA dioxygenase domain-containing protein 1 homolog [Argonauta hians]